MNANNTQKPSPTVEKANALALTSWALLSPMSTFALSSAASSLSDVKPSYRICIYIKYKVHVQIVVPPLVDECVGDEPSDLCHLTAVN